MPSRQINPPLPPPAEPSGGEGGGGGGTSGFAIAAMISSLLFCVPFVTSALAIVLAMIALIVTSRGTRGGRQTAVWALILGITGVALWTATFRQIQTRYIEPRNQFARFTQAIESADPEAARRLATPEVNVEAVIAQVKPLGRFLSFQPPTTPPTTSPAQPAPPRNDFPFEPATPAGGGAKRAWAYKGPMYFEHRTADAVIEVRQDPERWQVSRFDLTPRPPSGTTPATQPTTLPTTTP